jgi:hypothetical protein
LSDFHLDAVTLFFAMLPFLFRQATNGYSKSALQQGLSIQNPKSKIQALVAQPGKEGHTKSETG